MERARISGFVQTALIALFAGAVSCVLTAAVFLPSSQESTPSVELSGVQRGQFESVAEALIRIENRIQDLHVPLVSQHARRETVEGSQAGDTLEQVLERLDTIERRLATLSLVRGRTSTEPIQRDVPNDWQLLDELHSRAEDDYEGAAKSVALLTLPEIVERFGTPSNVSDPNGQLRVEFHRFSATGQRIGSVAVEFAGGYACSVDSEMDPK